MAYSIGCRSLTVGLVGLVIVIAGIIIGWVVVPSVVKSKIADILVLDENSESWDRWISPPVPIQFRVYVFHVNNPDGILRGEKPNVTEKGPYVYKETRDKYNVTLDTKSSTVSYKTRFLYSFDQEASGKLREDDKVTVVNTPAIGFALITDNLKEINDVITMFDTALKKMWPQKNPFFLDTTVGDYLFGQLPMYCNQSVSINNVDTMILCEAFKLVTPRTVTLDNGVPYFNTFSSFRYKNNSHDGIFEMDSGHDSISNIGNIKTWEGSAELNNWKGKSCNKILGSDSTIFRPYLEMDDVTTMPVFNTDICRSINLTYEGEVEYKGVTGRRYVSDESVFGSVMVNKENYCYCPHSVRGITHFGGCLKSGFLEVATCQRAPVAISHPHFLMTDPSFLEKVDGLEPDNEKHKIFLDLEPYTGYPLRAASRVQINIFLKKIKEVELMKNLPNAMIPVLWVEEKIELTDDLIEDLNSQLFDNLKIADGIKYSMIVLGTLLAGGAGVFYFMKSSKDKEVV